MEWPRMSWCLQFLLFAVLIVVQICGSNACFHEEKIALLEYKEFLKFHNYSVPSPLSSWLNDSNSDCCTWKSVACDSSTGHVSHLSLDNVEKRGACSCMNSTGIKGSLFGPMNLSLFQPLKQLRSLNLSFNCFDDLLLEDRSVSTFKKLETLDLSHNSFNLTIMRPLKTLTSLKNLILNDNHMKGHFTVQELSVLQNLEILDLSANALRSPSTTQDFGALSKLKKLRTLDLGRNQFDKKMFKYLFALPALSSLFINNNAITGPLDSQGICNMKTLQELDLSFNNVNGTLDTCLVNLTSLRSIDLSHNYLRGIIPSPVIANLSSLEYLSLSNNNFEGSLSLSVLANHSKLKVLILGQIERNKFWVDTENPPNWIPSFQLKVLKMSSCLVNSPTRTMPSFLLHQHGLEYIDISENNLVGMFPNWLLLNNPRLQYFFLNDNSFIGSFQLPTSVNQHMDQLLEFDISGNNIHGSIPENIGFFFPILDSLNVSSNKLDGDIPTSIGKMSKLRILDLARNNFSGEIPNQILLGCISLVLLRVSHNSLQGEIFAVPPNWKCLEVLMMDNNEFNGKLKNGILSMNDVWALDISKNSFSGRLPGNWINKFGYFRVSENNFEGEIPKELCHADFAVINLSHNRFSGAIPSCFNMSRLEFIDLQGNSLTGTIPGELSRCSKLISIDLRDNKLSGSAPTAIYGLQNLMFLLLGGNGLQGELPNELCRLKRLKFLDLSRNNITGSIPSCFNNISFTNDIAYSIFESFRIISSSPYSPYSYGYHFEVQRDGGFSFSFEEELQLTIKSSVFSYKGDILNYISGLDLSFNQLGGEIPSQLGELPTLLTLNLSHNYLSGVIPKSFSKLEQIESLDLSYNNLSGNIPFQLEVLNFLAIFNVSYNNLSGAIPDQKQFGTFDESSYEGNPYLQFKNNRSIAILPTAATYSNDTEGNESAIDFTAFSWSFAASFVMVQFTLAAVLWINPHWRKAWFHYIKKCFDV